MADMDCESLLLDDGLGKYSEDPDDGDICFADEEELLADIDEIDLIPSKSPSQVGRAVEQKSEDVLDVGTHDGEVNEDKVLHKKNSTLMMVSSTTTNEPDQNLSYEEDEERETRFKQERQTSITTKKYANIPDSLDDVVVPKCLYNNNNRNQQSYKRRGRGFYNNNRQRNKPENKTVLINPHFKGKVIVTNGSKLNWDARQRLNYKHQVGQIRRPFIQQNINQVSDVSWNPAQNMQNQPQQFQPFIQQQAPQQQIYNQPPPHVVPLQHSQVPQQLLPTYSSQQCFIQPLQESFYPQPSHFVHPPHFNHPPPAHFQQQISQFNTGPTQYPQSHPLQMVPYNNPQYIAPTNQFVQHLEPPSQPMFNQSIPQNQASLNYLGVNSPNQLYPALNNNKRKPINSGVRKIKKRNQVVSKNLQEVRTVEIPDTTVKDDEDDATKQYRRLIEEQKKKREQILQQKEARRRQAALLEQKDLATSTEVIPIQQPKPIVALKPMQHHNLIQRVPLNRNVNFTTNVIHKVTPTIIKQANPNIKIINTNETDHEKNHLSSFLLNRKILAKDESLLDTNIVLLSNLAKGTTSVKLRKMCVGIGDVKNLQMSPKERQATIQFTSVASAHAFFKKYQRTMLDLSMIQVTLKPIS